MGYIFHGTYKVNAFGLLAEFDLTDDICRTLRDMLRLYKNTNDTTAKLNLLSVLDDFLELLEGR